MPGTAYQTPPLPVYAKRVAVACANANGSADLFIAVVHVDEHDYAEGVHYDLARDLAAENGYDGPFVCFDESEFSNLFNGIEELQRLEHEADHEALTVVVLPRGEVCADDAAAPGVYRIEVPRHRADGDAAAIALNVLAEHVPMHEPERFEIEVLRAGRAIAEGVDTAGYDHADAGRFLGRIHDQEVQDHD